MSILIYSKMTVASVAADSGNTAGKGVITLGSAIAPYLSAAAAGASDQQTLSYVISEGSRVQACRGVYTANGGTLTRATTYLSTAGTGANEVFDSGAVVTFCVLPADVPQSAADVNALLGGTAALTGAANTFTQGQTINGGLSVSSTINAPGNTPAMTVNSASGLYRWIRFASGGSPRFDLGVDATAESGSSAGSNFFMTAFNDSGNSVGVPLSINRASMAVTLVGPLNLSGQAITSFQGATGSSNGSAFLITANPGGSQAGGFIGLYGSSSNPSSLAVFGANYYNWVVNGAGTLYPGGDNTQDIGAGGQRARNLYVASGTINTSDEREKLLVDTGLLDADTGLLTAMGMRVWRKMRARTFQWKDAVERKGADKARWHFGLYAQDVEDALNAEEPGLAERCGMFCEDPIFETVMEPMPVQRQVQVDGVLQFRPVEDRDASGATIYEMVPGDVLMDGEPTRVVQMVGDVPTLVEVPQARMEERPVVTPDGQEVEGLRVMVPVRGPSKSVPRVVGQEPVMETVEEPQPVQKPVMVDGVQATRKGLRRDQTDLFYDAGLETLLAEQDARLTALEAKAA